MSVTNIRPTGASEYWFIELVDHFLSGVTDPGLVTTTRHSIEYGKDKTVLLAQLQAKDSTSKSKQGFSFISEVFDRLELKLEL